MQHPLKDGAKMYYEVHGNEQSAKTIVFIGGLSQSAIAWTGYLPFFKEDFKIVLLDLIFQGQSDAPDQHRSFEQHAADVIDLMEALSIDKASVAGISYGGAVLMRLLVHYPQKIEKGIIMASFAHKPGIFNAYGVAWTNALLKGGYELMLDVMLPSVLGKSYFENPLIPLEVMKTARKELHPSPQRLLKLMQATAESEDYRETLRSIKVPVMVMAGEEDVLCTPEMNASIAEHIPGAVYKELPKIGHTLNLEAVQASAVLIREFIA